MRASAPVPLPVAALESDSGIGTNRHSKIADGLPLSGEERSCSGHHRHDRV